MLRQTVVVRLVGLPLSRKLLSAHGRRRSRRDGGAHLLVTEVLGLRSQ